MSRFYIYNTACNPDAQRKCLVPLGFTFSSFSASSSESVSGLLTMSGWVGNIPGIGGSLFSKNTSQSQSRQNTRKDVRFKNKECSLFF